MKTAPASVHKIGKTSKAGRRPAMATDGTASGIQAGPLSTSARARVTLIMTKALDTNIELYCLATGRKKTAVIMTALNEFFERHRIDPSRDRSAEIHSLLAD